MRITYIASSAALLITIFSSIYTFYTKPKMAYIEMSEVFENFKMKKETDEKISVVESALTAQTDSIYFLMESLYAGFKEDKKIPQDKIDLFQNLEKVYHSKMKQKEESLARIMKEGNEKIWNRINQYVQEYGRKNNYKFILGANGMGSIMYADDTENLTTTIVAYINTKYEGAAQ